MNLADGDETTRQGPFLGISGTFQGMPYATRKVGDAVLGFQGYGGVGFDLN